MRGRWRRIGLAGAALLCAATPAASQHAIRGIAFDSLRSRPLAGALVTIEALGRATVTDSAGTFELLDLPAGRHELRLAHDLLDSLGLGEPRLPLEVPGDDRAVRIATPSFTTVWRSACGGGVPHDSGFVHGVVRDARTGAPVPGVDVQASWLDVGFDARRGVAQERLGGSVVTGASGRYAMCGVPNGVQLQMRARLGEARTDNVVLFHVAPGITRRDFLLASLGDSALRGVVRGVVRGATGGPVPNALVQWPGARNARTDAEGRFVLRDVLIGTRTLTVRSVGTEPMRAIADVPWGDTAVVEIVQRNVATLEPVDVVGSAVQRRFLDDLADRMALGVAKFMDSTLAERMGPVTSLLTSRTTAKLQRDGSVTFGSRDNPCRPAVWIDRRYIRSQDVGLELRLLDPRNVGAVEVYERAGGIPPEYSPPTGLGTPRCALVIWTKAMFP